MNEKEYIKQLENERNLYKGMLDIAIAQKIKAIHSRGIGTCYSNIFESLKRKYIEKIGDKNE